MATDRNRALRNRAKRAKERRDIEGGVYKDVANTLRLQALWILNERTASIGELARELGEDYSKIHYEVDMLEKHRRAKRVGSRKVRGFTEYFYAATSRAEFDAPEWAGIPPTMQNSLRASLLQVLMDDAVDAVVEDTYDDLEDAHMSGLTGLADRQCRREIVEVLATALEGCQESLERAERRLRKKDEEGMSVSVSMLGYASANKKRKVGPPTDAEELAETTGRKAKGNKPKGKAKRQKAKGQKTKKKKAGASKKPKRRPAGGSGRKSRKKKGAG